MSDPAVAVQRQQARQQGFLARLITLPFRLFGVLCGTLTLSVAIECIGLHFFWPEQGWHHAEHMLRFELQQLSHDFKRSALVEEPGRTAYHLIRFAHEGVFIKTGLRDWMRRPAPQTNAVNRHLAAGSDHIKANLIAAGYTVLVFLARLLVLCLTMPLFAMAAFVGFVDGLVRRDIRRFNAGRESGFLHHRVKASLTPLMVLPWVVYLALPVSISPSLILVPAAVVLGAAVDIATGSFKKYL